jgi:hypothetical protein
VKVRIYSEVWHGRRYWTYCVYDPAAPLGTRWRRIGAGRQTWAEALTDGCAALREFTVKAGAL